MFAVFSRLTSLHPPPPTPGTTASYENKTARFSLADTRTTPTLTHTRAEDDGKVALGLKAISPLSRRTPLFKPPFFYSPEKTRATKGRQEAGLGEETG